MAGSGNGQVTVDVGVRLQVLQSSVADMQKILAKLKPDSGGFKELSKIINDTKKEIDQLQVQTSKPFGSQKQFDQVEKTIDKVEESLTRAKMAVDRIDFSDLKLDNSQTQQLEDLKKKIEDINKAFNAFKEAEKTSLFGNADFKKFADTIDPNLINKSFDQVVKAVETKTNAINTKLQNSLENLNKYSSQIKIGANIEDFLKKGGITEKALGVEKFQEMFTKKSTFKSGGKNLFFEYLKEQFSITDAQINQLKNLSAPKIQELISSEEFWQPQLKAAKNATKSQVTARTEYNRLAEDMEVATKAGQPLAESLERVSDKSEEATTGINKVNKEISTTRQEFVDAAQGTESFSQSTSQMQQELEGFKNSLASANAEMINLQRQQQAFNSIKMAITNFMGFNQVLNITKKAVKEAMDHIKQLDTVMNGIAIVSDMTTKDLWQQVDMYSEMAQNYGTSIKGAYEVSKIYYQAGYETNDVLTLMNETLKMSKISGLDYATTTDYMMNALRGFKLEVEDASRVVDVYSGLAQNTAVSQQELAEAMSKTASSMEGVGSTFEETSAMIATMVAVTRESANNIGSAMKSIASRYGELTKDPTKMFDAEGEAMSFNKVDEALQSVGITLQTTDHQFRSFTDVILELSDVWDTLTSAQQRYIATQFAGNRQQNRFLALVGNRELLRENLDVSQNSEDVGTIQALKSLDSLESKLNQVEVAYQQFYTTIGAEEVWKILIDGTKNFINNLNQLPKLFGTIPLGAIVVISDAITLIKEIALKGLKLITTELGSVLNSSLDKTQRTIATKSEQAGKKAVESFNKGMSQSGQSNNTLVSIFDKQIEQLRSKSGALSDAYTILQQSWNDSLNNTAIPANYLTMEDMREELEVLLPELVKMGAISDKTANQLRGLVPIEALERLKELQTEAEKSGNRIETINTISKKLGSAAPGIGAAISTIATVFNNGSESGQRFAGILTIVGGALKGVGALAQWASTAGMAFPWLAVATAAVTVVNGLATAIETTNERIERLKKEAEELSNEAKIAKADYNSLQRTADKLDELKEKRYESAEAAEEYQSAVEELADKFPQLVTGLNDVGQVTIDTVAIEAQLEKARDAATEATLAAAKADRVLAEERVKQAEKNVKDKVEALAIPEELENFLEQEPEITSGKVARINANTLFKDEYLTLFGNNPFSIDDYGQYNIDIQSMLKDFSQAIPDAIGQNNGEYYVKDISKVSEFMNSYFEFLFEDFDKIIEVLDDGLEGLNNDDKIIEINNLIRELPKKTEEELPKAIENILAKIREAEFGGEDTGHVFDYFEQWATSYLNGSADLANARAALEGYEKIEISGALKRYAKEQIDFYDDLGEGQNLLLQFLQSRAQAYGDIELYIQSPELLKDTETFLASIGDIQEFAKNWANRANYSLNDWQDLLPNLNWESEIGQQITDYYKSLGDTFARGTRAYVTNIQKAADNYKTKGYTDTATNVIVEAGSVLAAISDMPVKSRGLITNIISTMEITEEGIDAAIEEIKDIDNSEEVQTSLENLKGQLLVNIPLSIQMATDSLLTQLEDTNKAIQNSYKGYSPTDIVGILDIINNYNKEAEPITTDDLNLKNGKFYLPSAIRELYINAINSQLSSESEKLKREIDILFNSTQGTKDFSLLVSPLYKAINNLEENFDASKISETTLNVLEYYDLIAISFDEAGNTIFNFTEKALELAKQDGFNLKSYIFNLLNQSLLSIRSGLKANQSVADSSAIDAKKETQDQLNSAISELNMSVGKYLTDDTYELFKAAGIFDEGTGFTVDENTKQIKSIGNIGEAFALFLTFLKTQAETTDDMLKTVRTGIVNEEQKLTKLYTDVYEAVGNWDEDSTSIDVSDIKFDDRTLRLLNDAGASIRDGFLNIAEGADIDKILNILSTGWNIKSEKVAEVKASRVKKEWENSADSYLIKVFDNLDKVDVATAEIIRTKLNLTNEEFNQIFGRLDGDHYSVENFAARQLMNLAETRLSDMSSLVGDAYASTLDKQTKGYIEFAKQISSLGLEDTVDEDNLAFLLNAGYDAKETSEKGKYAITVVGSEIEALKNVEAELIRNGVTSSTILNQLKESIFEANEKLKNSSEEFLKQLNDAKIGDSMFIKDDAIFDVLSGIGADKLETLNLSFDEEARTLTVLENASKATIIEFFVNTFGNISQTFTEFLNNAAEEDWKNSKENLFVSVLSDLDNVSYLAADKLKEVLNLSDDDFAAMFEDVGGHYKVNPAIRGVISDFYDNLNEEMPKYLQDTFIETADQITEKMISAGNQLEAQVGDKVGEDAAKILQAAGYGISQIGNSSYYLVESLGDVTLAYEEYYRTLVDFTTANAEQLNDARQKIVDIHNANRIKGQDIVQDLSDLEMGMYLNFTEELERIGINPLATSRDYFNQHFLPEGYDGNVDLFRRLRVPDDVNPDNYNTILGVGEYINGLNATFATILKDGTKLSDDDIQGYIQDIRDSGAKTAEDIKKYDAEHLNLYLGIYEDWGVGVHELQEKWDEVVFNGKEITQEQMDSYEAFYNLQDNLAAVGASIEDGILKTVEDSDPLGIQRAFEIYYNQMAITASNPEVKAQNERLLAQTRDSITAILNNYVDLISKGISGTLDNINKLELEKFAESRGLKLDFTATEKGLKLSQQSAMALYTTMKQVDYLQSRVVFKELSDNLKESTRSYQDVVAIQGRIADLQKQINSLPVGSARRKEYERELEVAKEIREVRSLTDENAFNFMNNDLPTPFKAQLGYWDSIGSAFKEMNDAADSGYMDVTKFYNMVNGFNDMAKQMGTSINFMGMELDGSMESASKLIQKGFSSLANVDGEGAKISLERWGNSFEDGAKGMQKGVKAGVRAMAKSQIEMLDAMIAQLELVVAMEELEPVDKDEDNALSMEELFPNWLKGDYTLGADAKDAIQNILDLADKNKDLSNALDKFQIEGKSMRYWMQQAIDGNIKNKDTAQIFQATLSALYTALQTGDWSPETIKSTIIQNLQANIKEGEWREFTLTDGTKVRVTQKGYIQQNENGEWQVNGEGKKYKTYKEAQQASERLTEFAKTTGITDGHINKYGLATKTYDIEDNVKVNITQYATGTVLTTVTDNGKTYYVDDIQAAARQLIKNKFGKSHIGQDDTIREQDILDMNLISKLNLTINDVQVLTGENVGSLSDKTLEALGIDTNLVYAIEAGIQRAFTDSKFNFVETILNNLIGEENLKETDTSKWTNNPKLVWIGNQLGQGIMQAVKNGVVNQNNTDPNAIPDAVADGVKDEQGTVESEGTELGNKLVNTLLAFSEPDGPMKIAGMDAATAFIEGFTLYNANDQTYSFGDVFGAQIMAVLRQALITDETRAIGQETVGTLIEGMTASDGKSSSKVQQLADSITGPIKTALTDLFSQTTLDDLIDLFKTNSDLVLAFDSIDISGLTETVTTFETAMATANTALGSIVETVNGLKATGPLYAAAFALAVNGVSDKTPGYAANFTTAVNGVKEDNVTQSEEFATAVNSVKTEKVELSKAFVNAIASVTKEQVAQAKKFTSAINDIDVIKVSYAHSFKGAINGITNNGPNAAAAFKSNLNSLRSKTVNVKVHVSGSGMNWWTYATASGNALAKGNNLNIALAGGRKTLMGELGPELYVTNGRYYVAGQNGAEMVDLPDDAIVFNHIQTKRLLGTGRSGRGKPVTNEKRAVSYATGNAGGPAMASARETLEQLKELRAMWQSMLNASFKQLGGLAASNKNKSSGTTSKPVTTKDENGNEKTTIIKISRVTDDINRWYNLMRQIDKLEKDIAYSEQLINKYQADRVVNGNKIYQNYKNQLKMLDSEISKNKELVQIQRDWYDHKRDELANSAYGLIFTYDENGLQQFVDGENRGLDLLEKLNQETIYGEGIQYSTNVERQLDLLYKAGFNLGELAYDDNDVGGISAVSGYNLIYDKEGKRLEGQELADAQAKLMSNFFDNLDSLRDDLDSLYDSMHDTELKILEEQVKQNEILQEITNNQLEVEDTVLNAITDAREAEIDELQKERDAYQKTVDKMISGLNNALDNEQRMYEDDENRSELTKLQRQLAILQRSGGSASQIRDLQNQITSQQKDLYFDERQKEIQAIQDASDKQIEKMDAQIDLMNDTLEYQKDHGLLWNQVYSVMAREESEILGFITENGADWEAKSSLQKQEDIRAILEKIQIWTQSRDDKELQELSVKIDNQEATTTNRSESSFNKADSTVGTWSWDLEPSAQEAVVTSDENGNWLYNNSNNYNDDDNYNSKYSNNPNERILLKNKKFGLFTQSGTNGNHITVSYNGSIQGNAGDTFEILDSEYGSYRSGGSSYMGWLVHFLLNGQDYYGFTQDPHGNSTPKDISKKSDYGTLQQWEELQKKKTKKYASGGLIDFTGPAWVDGSKSKPESILSAEQTKGLREFVNELKAKRYTMQASNSINFEELYKMRDSIDEMRTALDKLYDNPNSSDTNNMGITIENVVLNMNVSKIANDYDAARAGQKVLDEFVRVARKNGVNSLSRR